jgi:hypothetical protein
MLRTVTGLAGLLALLTTLSSPALAEIIRIEIPLSGDSEVPPVGTPGVGLLTAEFDTDAMTLRWTITYQDLSAPPTAAHFHGPAALGVNAGVAIAIEGDLASPMVGEAVLSEAEANDLLGGLYYLNIHTPAFPAGEIRGQVVLAAP